MKSLVRGMNEAKVLETIVTQVEEMSEAKSIYERVEDLLADVKASPINPQTGKADDTSRFMETELTRVDGLPLRLSLGRGTPNNLGVYIIAKVKAKKAWKSDDGKNVIAAGQENYRLYAR